MIGYIIALVIEGLILGALARLALPGRDPMSIPQTIAVGVAGALVAGLLARIVFDAYAGFLLAFTCTFGIVYLIRRRRGGSLTEPAGRERLPR